jgi:hypothetical protein
MPDRDHGGHGGTDALAWERQREPDRYSLNTDMIPRSTTVQFHRNFTNPFPGVSSAHRLGGGLRRPRQNISFDENATSPYMHAGICCPAS